MKKRNPAPKRKSRPARPYPPITVDIDAVACSDAIQMVLPGVRANPASRFRDSAFMENRNEPVHRWVPWIAGFSSGFVDDCLSAFLGGRAGREAVVLDPFAGVGTTLVAAVRRGHRAVGFEVNPYAALASRVKLRALSLDIGKLERQIRSYENARRNGYKTAGGSIPPEFVTRIPFFSPGVERQVFGFRRFLGGIRDTETADVFRLAFGAVMVSFSNYTYEPSLCSRPGAGKPLVEQADVHGAILKRLREMLDDIRWLQAETESGTPAGEGEVHEMNFMDALAVQAPGSVNLAVTSPPYMNNYHYIRSTRPQLFWLDLVTERRALRSIEEANVGKYWQTVRDRSPLALEFSYPELEGILAGLRQIRKSAGAYGGPGWANYVAAYFNDTHRYLQVMKQILARRGVAVIVIGNSIIQGIEVGVDRILAGIARQLGYHVEGIELLRAKRVGASITKSAVRRGAESRATLHETAVILRKK